MRQLQKHVFTLPFGEGPLFNRAMPVSRSQPKLKAQILETPGEFITETNLSCCPATSPAMHTLVFN
jgi:hypothetical protein